MHYSNTLNRTKLLTKIFVLLGLHLNLNLIFFISKRKATIRANKINETFLDAVIMHKNKKEIMFFFLVTWRQSWLHRFRKLRLHLQSLVEINLVLFARHQDSRRLCLGPQVTHFSPLIQIKIAALGFSRLKKNCIVVAKPDRPWRNG